MKGYAYALFPREPESMPVGVWTEKWYFVAWWKKPLPGGEKRNPENYVLLRYCGDKPPVELNLHDVVS